MTVEKVSTNNEGRNVRIAAPWNSLSTVNDSVIEVKIQEMIMNNVSFNDINELMEKLIQLRLQSLM